MLYFLALILFIIITFLLYKYFFKNLISSKNVNNYNINIEEFENTLPADFKQNVYSIKDLTEINMEHIHNNDAVFNDMLIENINDFIQSNYNNSKKQYINVIKIDESLNKYKIIVNNNNDLSLSLNHENINEVIVFNKYLLNNNNSWKIEVTQYNPTHINSKINGHNIVIYSYLDLNKCITLQDDGTYKLETYNKNNKKQVFIYDNNNIKCIYDNSYIELSQANNNIAISNINKFYENIIAKDNNGDLYRLFYDVNNSNVYKQKFSNYKVFNMSQYKNGLLININKELIEELPEQPILGFKDIIIYYFNINNIGDGSIIKKKGTYNYFLIENIVVGKESEYKKICFEECKDTLSINNNDRVIDIYVRNINNKDIPVYVIDENIVNAIEYSIQETINYENVIPLELNKYMDLYNIDKFLFNDTLLILREGGVLYKKTIPNTEILNLFKLLYIENTNYMKLLFNYPISEISKTIPNYVINYNELIVNNEDYMKEVSESNKAIGKSSNDSSENTSSNEYDIHSTKNIHNKYEEKYPGILSAKYIFYENNLLGLVSENKYNYMIIKSDIGNIYYIGSDAKGNYKKYKFYDNQQVQLAFYSKILDKQNILQKHGEYYILSESIIDTIAELGVPEYYSYKNLLVSLWELNDNLHFDRRDKLMETDKYVDTYSKVVDIDKANKHYFMKILTYDMYQTLKLSQTQLNYRDKLANTNLTNNAFIQESSVGINRDYYTIPEFLYNVMKLQQSDIITNKDKTKFYKVEFISDLKLQVVPTNMKDNIKVIANEALFNIIKQNI